MGILALLAKLIPLKIRISLFKEKKEIKFILDRDIFPECNSKIVEIWNWKRFKNEKIAVHFKEGKFITRKL